MVSGKIYVIGGTHVWPDGALSTVEEYNPAANAWTKKADMPTARINLAASTVNGKIYAIGGSTKRGDAPIFSTVEEYTPEGWPFDVSPEDKLATTWGAIKQF